MSAPKIKELAARIDAHLKRFEKDPVINEERFYPHPRTGEKTSAGHPYYYAAASASGRWVSIHYVAYQGNSSLTKAQAIKYLDWLDDGNVGRHSKAFR